jgi:predicted LPLAT superfamily acyltransferase
MREPAANLPAGERNGRDAFVPPRWSGRTRGGYFGNWWFVQLIRCFGLRAAYAWLVLVAAWFTVAAPASYRCSVGFLQRVLGPQPFWRWPALVYRHFYSFGVTLLDRLAVIMGRGHMEFVIDGEERFHEFLDEGRGIILLGAHVGGWEMAGHVLGRLGRPVNLIVLEKEQARIRALFDRALQARQFQILTADDHPLRSIPIMAALRRGEIVALHGDRAFGGAEVRIPFLGGPARFPVGGYMLAAATGAPVFQVFAVRERMGCYRCFTFPAQRVGKDLLRRGPDAFLDHVRLYAERLASVARQYPFQWYNLYPFWDDPSAGAPPPMAAAGPAEPKAA